MKAYETKVSRPSLQVCHVNAMEYDGLWMNAFQTGSGAQRRSHGAAFSGPGYHDDADDGGAGQGTLWPCLASGAPHPHTATNYVETKEYKQIPLTVTT